MAIMESLPRLVAITRHVREWNSLKVAGKLGTIALNTCRSKFTRIASKTANDVAYMSNKTAMPCWNKDPQTSSMTCSESTSFPAANKTPQQALEVAQIYSSQVYKILSSALEIPIGS